MASRPSFNTVGLHQGPQGTQKLGLLHHAKHMASAIQDWFGHPSPHAPQNFQR